jgi:hypothetical protein
MKFTRSFTLKPDKLMISPQTKVAELLDVYPQLESVLIEMAPAFAKLRNPVLRRTVARVASLQQAATVGGITLGKMITRLRHAVGQEEWKEESPLSLSPRQLPEWFDPARISRHLDARPILDAGQNPMNAILGEVRQLPAGGIFRLTAPFVPAPMIDQLKKRGFIHWSSQPENDRVETYFKAQ